MSHAPEGREVFPYCSVIENLQMGAFTRSDKKEINIDIEQVDYLDDLPEFLKTMNNPTLLCIEWVSQGFGIGNYKESKEFKILSDCGYQISNIVGGNLFAVQSN